LNVAKSHNLYWMTQSHMHFHCAYHITRNIQMLDV